MVNNNLESNLRKKFEELNKVKVLDLILKLDSRTYRLLIQKRLSFSSKLEIFLEKLIHFSESKKQFEVSKILKQNLIDEKGEDNNSAHFLWRENFLKGIGIKNLFKINKEYEDIVSFSYIKLLGVVLYIEGSIPIEFSRLKMGRDLHFPNLTTKENLYFNDHIIHDANNHYPLLKKAILNLNLNSNDLKELLVGIEYIHNLRMIFYNEFYENISK